MTCAPLRRVGSQSAAFPMPDADTPMIPAVHAAMAAVAAGAHPDAAAAAAVAASGAAAVAAARDMTEQ